MNVFDRIDKELIDEWRAAAALVPESTRQEIVTMKKSHQSVREICGGLDLPVETVSIIVIEAFAKERGEAPEFTTRGF